MIRITQLKVSIDKMKEGKEEIQLKKEVAKLFRMDESKILKLIIRKKSIDARKKNEIKYIYTVDVSLPKEDAILKRNRNQNITLTKDTDYGFAPSGKLPLKHRPVVVGTGPAGLFCAYMLAKEGYKPIVLERGADVDTRVSDVNEYWKTRQLKPESNVQFGEGGAGTFSDGKLNTVVKDASGRNMLVYEVFVEHGAPEEILYQNKPHIGTDRLRDVVRSMRKQIIAWGGEVHFNSKMTDLIIEDNTLKAIVVNDSNRIDCNLCVLALGHSARDSFEMMYKRNLPMEQKNFAIGLRIEHPQEVINQSQYGDAYNKLPAADYKLTYHASNNRSIYSFCMCPGGFVVNASSEEGHMVVNGMSNYKRDAYNANSAMVVNVTKEDFEGDSPLAGMYFQRKFEKAAYELGKGFVPIQRFGDFKTGEVTKEFGNVNPNIKGEYTFANLRECVPNYVAEAIVEGVEYFESKIKGFGNEDAILSGVETRTSSPIRILRNEEFESTVSGIYPCGEGAGYAGGITSAAMDGIKVFEAIANRYTK